MSKSDKSDSGIAAEARKLKALAVEKRKAAMASPSGIVPTTKWHYGAWQFLLSYDAPTRLWIFSAMLYPHGRGSVDEDWRVLGLMTASIGAPVDALMGNTIETAPNAVHKWAWNEPASAGAQPAAEKPN